VIKMEEEGQEFIRVRVPEKGEILGVVKANLGGSRFEIKCIDGFTRICRIPGRFKKRVWVKVGGLILITPWEVQSNERGDIIWTYTKAQELWLERKGFLKSLEEP
jgi:translation initiation factor 1A